MPLGAINHWRSGRVRSERINLEATCFTMYWPQSFDDQKRPRPTIYRLIPDLDLHISKYAIRQTLTRNMLQKKPNCTKN